MSDRLKLSDSKGDDEAQKIAIALERTEQDKRIKDLESNIAVLEQELAAKKSAPAAKAGNNKIGARKHGRFKAIGTAPSINKTPIGSAMVPIPYPTVQELSNSVNTARTVNFNGSAAYLLDETTQPKGKGDERGTGKGVKSGTVTGEVKPTKGSTTVRVEGKQVVRQGDACTMNGGNNPGIYVTSQVPASIHPRNAVQCSNPALNAVGTDWGTQIGDWYENIQEQTNQALLRPTEGIKGAIKGALNSAVELAEIIVKASIEQRACELSNASIFQYALGEKKSGIELDEIARKIHRIGEDTELPKLNLSNLAQLGGNDISSAIQLLSGLGILKKSGALLGNASGRILRKHPQETFPPSSSVGVKVVGTSTGVATKPNEAFFWSGRTNGRGGPDVSAEIARNQGGTTLEMLIEQRKIVMPKWDPNNLESVQAWENISAEYADNVSGKVRAVVGSSLRLGNLWENKELPALLKNVKVTEIVIIDPDTKLERVILRR